MCIHKMEAFLRQAHINQVLAQHNANYKAMYVSWNDNQRQQGSCFGSNITDARLKGKARIGSAFQPNLCSIRALT